MAEGPANAGGLASLGQAVPGGGMEGSGQEVLDGGPVPGGVEGVGQPGSSGLPNQPAG